MLGDNVRCHMMLNIGKKTWFNPVEISVLTKNPPFTRLSCYQNPHLNKMP